MQSTDLPGVGDTLGELGPAAGVTTEGAPALARQHVARVSLLVKEIALWTSVNQESGQQHRIQGSRRWKRVRPALAVTRLGLRGDLS